ncbi:hypothetical protein [Maritimibacter sp. HL-12]|uniref:hypothetical protein n=1 Tax=Maritimibacter sp. HL-12 TaxID=1162418 RepID=UPI000A0F0A51|nr:hypothetical protein [Maritimibacter sp. HL-12]SMH36026.1 hypothetical protein SAMN05661107_0676 [Maritimibacter sp. HL-12]
MTILKDTNPLATIREAWGDDAPDWIVALADEAAQTSQAKAAARIGRSGALVSQVLHRRYTGSMVVVEELVRAKIMAELVSCPSLGELPLAECRDWRSKARHFMSTNAMRVRMYRACTRCPIFKEAERK